MNGPIQPHGGREYSCQTCVYFYRDLLQNPGNQYQCRRNDPVLMVDKDGFLFTNWPT
ncbi:unnamed protein product, partial [marine sediment metagenome]